MAVAKLLKLSWHNMANPTATFAQLLPVKSSRIVVVSQNLATNYATNRDEKYLGIKDEFAY